MIKYYKKVDEQIKEISSAEKGSWINISPPFNPEILKQLSEELKIPHDFLTDSLDIDERSRYEIEEGVMFIVINTPVINEQMVEQDAIFITIPLGIIVTPKGIVTLSPYANPIISDFIDGRIRDFDPAKKNMFILNILERGVHYYLRYLKEVNIKRNIFERELRSSMKNEKLFKLLNIEKSLVYFVTSLRSNEMLMLKLHRTNILKLSEEELDLLQDITVDNSQANEMANIYTNILSSSMDAFASIISNNVGTVMKRLTSVTIILMIPTLVASFYGMNVKLPFENTPAAFLYTLLISLVLIIGTVWFFARKRWF